MTEITYNKDDIDSMIKIMMKKVVYHENAALIYKKGITMLQKAELHC